MHRKHLRATVNGTDVDIPIGAFVDAQYLTFSGGQIITAPLVLPEGDVTGPASSTDNAIVRWDGASGTAIQNSSVIISDLAQVTGVTALNGRDIAQWVDGPSLGSTTTNHVAIWIDSGSRDIADSGLHIGNIVRNEGSEVTTGHLAEFGDSSGRVLVDSGVIADHVVTCAGTSTDNALARWDGVNGKVIQNSVVLLSDTGQITGVTALNTRDIARWVDGPAIGSVTDNAVARWDSTTGRLIQDSAVVIDDAGNLTGVGTINGEAWPQVIELGDFVSGPTPAVAESGNLAVWDGTSGRLIADSELSLFDIHYTTDGEVTSGHLPEYADSAGRRLTSSGIVSDHVVTSGSVGADNRVARYDGASRAIQSSNVAIDDSGNLSGVGTINGVDVTASGDVFGPAGATDNRIARFNGTTGKLIQQGAIGLDDSGNLTGVGQVNGYTIGAWGDVSGPASAADNRVARFDGITGKVIQSSSVIVDDDGNLSNVGTINGDDPDNWTVGPSSAADNRVARFDGSSGKLIQSSNAELDDSGNLVVTQLNGRLPSRFVEGPTVAASTTNAIARWTNTGGRTIANSAVTLDVDGNIAGVGNLAMSGTLNGRDPDELVRGPGGATDNRLARFDGTTGYLIQNSAITVDDSGNISGVGTLNGVTLTNFVSNAGTSADNRIARFDGTTGKIVQNSAISIDDSGNLTGVGTVNGSAIGDVTGPASSTSNMIAVFNGTTGKVISQSAYTVDSLIAAAQAAVVFSAGSVTARTVTTTEVVLCSFGPSASGNYVYRVTVPYAISDTGSNIIIKLLWASASGIVGVTCHAGGGQLSTHGQEISIPMSAIPPIGVIMLDAHWNATTAGSSSIGFNVRSSGASFSIATGTTILIKA